ncbi:MAG TPA: sorbosone dehydrogenase family protein [Usitatibacter sp.]|nr:sorbosone dehydrogenase family protein [Usitatibacter sp.]
MRPLPQIAAVLLAATLPACAENTRIPDKADVGPSPTLVEPVTSVIPTVNVAEAKGWQSGTKPVAAQGLKVNALVTDLDHPRWIHVLPNGDVLVAETRAPERPEDSKGVKAKAMGFFMKKAGSAGKSANRITLLRDADGDGVAEVRSVFLENLNSPFGMALVGDQLYIANTDAIVRVPYKEGETRITATPVKVADLPGGPRNHHWTKSLIASKDGSKLYATVGSNSNIAENGMAEEEGRAAIWEIDTRTGAKRLFATGLRNPNGMGWEPSTGMLWTVVNERDELGSDLVPDYLTSVREGAFYGWPYSYYGQHVDKRPQPPRPDLVAKATTPDYALGSHVAPLGMAFAEGARLGERFASGAFVGQHGSWNRKPFNGYNVVFVPFAHGKPAGKPVEVLNGFLNEKGEALGRPVGVAIDKRGALLVADDVGNAIWRVSAG